MKVGSEYYFYHNDHLGTPQKMTTISGAVVWSAKYGSFGQAEVDPASTITNNLRFPGQYYDDEIALHYNYHRYFNPVIGRYQIQDPLGIEGGLNLYSYAINNPTKYHDPDGRTVVVVPIAVTLIVLIAAIHYLQKHPVAVPAYNDDVWDENEKEIFVTPGGIVIVISCSPGLRKWCKEEIISAENMCIDFFSHPDSGVPKGVCGPGGKGGWDDIEDCVKGNIPEICGGKRVR